jgi:hypothetical protein
MRLLNAAMRLLKGKRNPAGCKELERSPRSSRQLLLSV